MNKHANKNIKTCVVGNPANTNCLIAAANAPDINPANFTAMTRLDHNRSFASLACSRPSARALAASLSRFQSSSSPHFVPSEDSASSQSRQRCPFMSPLHIFSLTRTVFLFCFQANCSVNDISKFAIWGNHSPTMSAPSSALLPSPQSRVTLFTCTPTSLTAASKAAPPQHHRAFSICIQSHALL